MILDAIFRSKKMAESTGVYVMQSEVSGHLKVGWTGHLLDRLRALISAHGPMRIVAWWHINVEGDHRRYGPREQIARRVEVDVQARLYRWVSGGEWFFGTVEAVALVAKLRERPYKLVDHQTPRFVTDKARRCWLAEHVYGATGATP